jgi:hypothetical protein
MSKAEAEAVALLVLGEKRSSMRRGRLHGVEERRRVLRKLMEQSCEALDDADA